MMILISSHRISIFYVADNCQLLLKHSHEWVRLSAAQILGLILKSLDIHEVTAVIVKPSKAKEIGFLVDQQARKQLRSLCQDFCDQLVPGHDIMEQLLKQVSFLFYNSSILKTMSSVSCSFYRV